MVQTVGLIAKNIRRLRDVKRLSQKEVCADSGVPQGQYSRIENAKVEPSISTLEKLASAFEVDVAEFFKSDDLVHEVNLPPRWRRFAIGAFIIQLSILFYKLVPAAVHKAKLNFCWIIAKEIAKHT